jgi:hypothetical protein
MHVAHPTKEWLAAFTYLDRTDADHPILLWHGHPHRITALALELLLCLRDHPDTWLSVWDLLAAVGGPTATLSPRTIARELNALLRIGCSARHLHHQHGGLWCWSRVPNGPALASPAG